MSALDRAWRRLTTPEMTVRRIVLGLAGLIVVSFLLRTTALHGRYWIDEGLSVGIASHPLTDIPGVLRADGSPPLYYMLLKLWIGVIGGDGEARTHALSLGFALLTVPAGFFSARALFDERAGWFVAVVAALNPFLNYYAQETRMYALVVLLSLLVAATFGLAFVERKRVWLVGFVLASTALIYSHNWGLFTMVGTVAALLPLLWSRRVPWTDAAIAYGAIALLYLPWLPTLLYQVDHTGAPWSRSPTLNGLPGALAGLAGGPGPGVGILLAVGTGIFAYASIREGDAPARQSSTANSTLIIVVVGIAVAFVVSQISPAWSGRYFAALIGPFVLLIGVGLARAGVLGLVTLALLAGLWMKPPTFRVNNKSDVHRVAAVVGPRLAPGDIVVSTHPEQLPVVHFYFPKGLRWGDGMGWVKDPTYMDWRDALDRYEAARPTQVAQRFIAALRPGQQLALVQPIIRSGSWSAPWTELVRKRASRWERVLGRDDRLQRVAALPVLKGRGLPRGVRVVIYRRVG
ncbi:MAG TPA: glycosyltransferase family 39 protein [Solirubrobacteraceae bacterium]|nr:glycosyltransferase family 39 protein [Solirubrobacteraceae bacterium]